MNPLQMPALTEEQVDAVAKLYRTTHNVRLRTRAQMVSASRRAAPHHQRDRDDCARV